MADINKLIEILNQRDSGGPGPKSKQVKGTGLSVYQGGIERTPTGKPNAFSESGLTEQDLLDYASKFNLPTTSNKEFQQAQIDMLMKTPEGKAAIDKMYSTYGTPKAGSYIDDILGARTLQLMQNTPTPQEPTVPTRTGIVPNAPISQLTKMVSAEPEKEKQKKYTISWRDENADNASGTSSKSFPTEKDYQLELAKIASKNAGRGFESGMVAGQGKGESSRNALFIGNPFAQEKRSAKDIEFAKENYKKRLVDLKDKYKLSDKEIEDMVNNFK